MADKTLSQVIGSSSGSIPRLAPDLTYPSSTSSPGVVYKQITGIDASSGLTTALSLSGGKFYVGYLSFQDLTAENITIKLTVDGEVKWNDTYTSSTLETIFGNISTNVSELQGCEDSFLLEVQTATDTDITLVYHARPIL